MRGSVIKRMYAGFTLIVILFIVTIALLMGSMDNIYAKFGTVTQKSLPLVSLSNQTSVQLLSADKAFKDFLTSQEQSRMAQTQSLFLQAQTDYTEVFNELKTASTGYDKLHSYLEQLELLEARYFSEASEAMKNYMAMFSAQEQVQLATRDFHKLNFELTTGMKEHVASLPSIAVKLMAKSYFSKLKDAENITSDALASTDTERVKKAVEKNKEAITHLNFAFNGLVAQLPSLKEKFEDPVVKFTQDMGGVGGVLAEHFEYLTARKKLYDNIANLALLVDEATDLLAHFNEVATMELVQSLSEADAINEQSQTQALIIGLVVVITAIAIGYHVAHSVREPVKRILTTLESLTKGDMTQRIEIRSNNEFSRVSGHINTLADSLHTVLMQLNQASDNLTTAANINHGSSNSAQQKLSSQKEQTAAVAAAMTEMEHSVVEVAQSAQSASEKVHLVESASESGRKIMNSNITAINQLESRLNKSVEAVGILQNMSGEIGSILDVIINIAEQTNLLALNAAIEAARAGDQGRGFAVVADEVRVLAQRTAESTAEIESMISNLQSSSESVGNVIESCMKEMEQSVSQASQANSSMEEIQALILEISKMSSHISLAAAEQSKATSEIARNLEDINHIAEESHQAMSEIIGVSTDLTQLAQQQGKLVNRFRL